MALKAKLACILVAWAAATAAVRVVDATGLRVRKLPGSKGGTGSGSSKKNCVGAWGSWGACSGSKSKRKYAVTQYQSGGGSSCPHSAGSEQERSCSNCAGSWSAWSACSSGQQTRTYSISTAASGGGSSCPHSDGHSETQVCNNAVNCVGSWSAWTTCSLGTVNRTRHFQVTTPPAHGGAACPETGRSESIPCDTSKIVPVTWQAQSGRKELDLVMCPKGSYVQFSWQTDAGVDIYLMSGESGMVSCDFAAQGSSQLSSSSSGSLLFPCVTPGSHYFSSSSGTACKNGLRIQVQVTQPARTANLRSTFNNVTGKNHTSLAAVMADIIKADRKGGFDSNAEADALLQKLWCIVPHSPESCSDYFPDSFNSNAQCMAWIMTDIGFVHRKRPTPEYDQALKYYEKALEYVPNFCQTQAYMTELYIQQGLQTQADAQFAKACSSCGKNNRDIESIKSYYKNKKWKIPGDVKCGTSISKEKGGSDANESGKDGRSAGKKESTTSMMGMSPLMLGGVAAVAIGAMLAFTVYGGVCSSGEVAPKKELKK